jgi:hypothetical protein
MTRLKQLQRIVDEYRLESLPWPTSAKNMPTGRLGRVSMGIAPPRDP